MSGCQRVDRRFPIHRTPADVWRRATEINIAADRAAGFADAGADLLVSRPDLADFREFVDQATVGELREYASAHRHQSLAFLVLMLTGACDADCEICFTDRRKKRGETTVTERRQLLREASELGARFVYVPGEGEPTLDPGWWDFLDAVRDFGLHAVVFTNSLAFGDDKVAQKRWGCSAAEALERLRGYPVSFYSKLWSFDRELMARLLCISPQRVPYRPWNGMPLPAGLATMLDILPRERVGIEVVIERRNAREVIDAIAPFSDEHGLSRIIEIIQHNGRTLGRADFDPSPQEAEEAEELLSVTSCTMATCKAVVTARGMLSPRIAILEHQIPDPVRIDTAPFWELLHSTPYVVDRRYQLSCLCELEPARLATSSDKIQVRPGSVAPQSLAMAGAPAATSTETATQQANPDQTSNDQNSNDQTSNDQTSTSPRYGVAQLLAGAAPAGHRARVVGRVHRRNGSSWSLQDGPRTLQIQGLAPPSRAWVEVEGRPAANGQDVQLVQDGAPRTLRPGYLVSQPGRLPEAACIAEPSRLQQVERRARALRSVRAALDADGFLEVTTPFLQTAPEMSQVCQAEVHLAGGGVAYLRTDPEEYLKRYLTAGLEAVYEISTNVRDEAPDTAHLREFQSLEYYHRGWGFDETVAHAETLVSTLWACADTNQGPGARPTPYRQLEVGAAVRSATGLDLNAPHCATAAGLQAAIATAGLEVDVPEGLQSWRRSWVEGLLDRYVCNQFEEPTWLVAYPAELALSARVADGVALRGELFAPGGLELAHVYENEVRPGVLRHRYAMRQAHREASGLPPRGANEPLFQSLRLGMPPMAGGAIGLDRILMVASGEAEVGTGLLFARETSLPSAGISPPLSRPPAPQPSPPSSAQPEESRSNVSQANDIPASNGASSNGNSSSEAPPVTAARPNTRATETSPASPAAPR